MNEDNYTKVYFGPSSRVAHLVGNTHRQVEIQSVCGKFPRWFLGWLGTGDQDEIDRAQALPLCRHCKTFSERT